jgi:hypothetical protein
MDGDLWERLEEAVKRADPDDNRPALLRRFARWYVGDIDQMPKRPEPKAPSSIRQSGTSGEQSSPRASDRIS